MTAAALILALAVVAHAVITSRGTISDERLGILAVLAVVVVVIAIVAALIA